MVKAIDCATQLTTGMAKGLKAENVELVGRYLVDPSSWKALTKREVEAIGKAGLKIISIFETNPTKSSYFTEGQGREDAKNATKYARNLGQPSGTAIYFAVDYDAHSSDMRGIKNYFTGVIAGLGDAYSVGVYGSYDVVQALKGKVGYLYQTYAWSGGKVADHAHIYQYHNGQRLAGVSVDFNKVLRDPGAWALAMEPERQTKAEHITTDIDTYTVESGDSLSVIGANLDIDWHEIAELNGIKEPYTIYPGQELKLPDGHHGEFKIYTVDNGDYLSKIGQRLNVNWHDLARWNHLKPPYTIYPGQKLKYKK